jgi:hypothetical protein
MIRLLTCVLLSLLVAFQADAQKSRKSKKKRSDFFGGAEDYRDLRNYGLQITFGPNYTFTRLNNETVSMTPETGQRYNYVQDPAGRLGGFIDVGMVHYRMKKPSFLKKNIIHYLDWGIGFDYIGGREKTTIDYLDPLGDIASTAEGEGKFYNGYLYGRVTFHRLLKMSEKLHLDYGLGINANYAILEGTQDYDGAVVPDNQVFQRPFMLQVHAQLGVNIRLRRGDYLVPGIWAPVIGAYEWNDAKPTIQWYSSNYWPVHLQLKWLHNFSKKSNGCNTGTDADKQRNKEYMQNR